MFASVLAPGMVHPWLGFPLPVLDGSVDQGGQHTGRQAGAEPTLLACSPKLNITHCICTVCSWCDLGGDAAVPPAGDAVRQAPRHRASEESAAGVAGQRAVVAVVVRSCPAYLPIIAVQQG